MSATKNPLINVVIALLVAASLAMLCIPCYVAEGDSTSVMGYIFMNTEHDGVTALLKQSNPDFLLNGQVWAPIFLFLLGVFTLYMMIAKRNLTSSLYCPIIYSVCALLVVWTNELTRLGGVTVWPTVIALLTIALCLFNGSWFAGRGEQTWTKDPQARGKLRNIEKAIEKKNVEALQAHMSSSDVSVRIAAIEGMAKVGGNAVFQPLIAQLSCSEPDVRIAAAGALGELGDQRGRSYLLHYMESDPDSRVRTAMRKAISKLPSQAE